jgi:hypothetical protein
MRNFPQGRCPQLLLSSNSQAITWVDLRHLIGLHLALLRKALVGLQAQGELFVMSAAGELNIGTRNLRLRPIALPVEHGGWGLLLEPILLGLLLAPSIAGLCFSFAAVSAFLLRHPLTIAVGNLRRNRQTTRTPLVQIFTLTYTLSSIIFLTVGVMLGGSKPLTPLLIGAPLVLIQARFDFSGRSRELIPELAGSIAAGSLATLLALSAGWTSKTAFVLWVIIIARSVPTVLYLRARLRLLHGKAISAVPTMFAHIAALSVLLFLIKLGLVPLLAVVAALILFLRAVVGLSNPDAKTTARELGTRELFFGAITVMIVAAGYLGHI